MNKKNFFLEKQNLVGKFACETGGQTDPGIAGLFTCHCFGNGWDTF